MRLRPDLANLSELLGVHMVWVSDSWDGPTEGMATYHGRECWFDAVWDEEADEYTNRRSFASDGWFTWSGTPEPLP